VAGALTFFPPDPPLYKFERIGEDGNKLPDTEEEEGENNKDKQKNEETKEGDTSDESGMAGNGAANTNNDGSGTNDGMELVITDEGVYQAKEGQTTDIVRSPAQQFTDQAKALRKLGKQRNIRDTKDALRGITYRLFLDPRLQPPRFHNGCSVTVVKIPTSSSTTSSSSTISTTSTQSQSTDNNKKKNNKSHGKNHNHCAAIVYKVPPVNQDRTSEGKKTMTVIYSHGNATDIGAMYPLQAILSNSLECNVVSYDYSGYGESGGIAMEANTYTDIAGVYAWTLANVCQNDKSRILLYGQSVGSGPCCHLAQKIGVGLGGMILHSPFMSGMRVLTPSRALACLDIYPNIDRVRQVKCPVMVIHGKLDEEVDISHGTSMHQAVPTLYQRDPWWVPDRGHNDITEGPGKLAEYVGRLRQFIESL